MYQSWASSLFNFLLRKWIPTIHGYSIRPTCPLNWRDGSGLLCFRMLGHGTGDPLSQDCALVSASDSQAELTIWAKELREPSRVCSGFFLPLPVSLEMFLLFYVHLLIWCLVLSDSLPSLESALLCGTRGWSDALHGHNSQGAHWICMPGLNKLPCIMPL